MKKFLKIIGITLIVVALLVGAGAAYIQFNGIPTYKPGTIEAKVEVTPERVEQGERIASMLCMECHMGEKSEKMIGKFVPDIPKMFGEIHSANITNDKDHGIGGWTDGELMYFLRTGIKRDGTYAPAYMPKFPLMSDEDLKSVVAWLRSDRPSVQADNTPTVKPKPSFFSKFLCYVAFKPFPYPTQPIVAPDTADKIAFGKYIANGVYACFGCHSPDFAKMNSLEPEKTDGYYSGGNPMLNREGKEIYSSNLTWDQETGIANYTEDDFLQAVKYGKKKSGKPVQFPMFPHTRLTDTEVRAIYAFLKTVPVMKNPNGKQKDS